MAGARRFYLTTAIAYANSRPGLHTLYEVVGADAIARSHRMRGDDTYFAPRRRSEPGWVRVTAAWAAQQRGTGATLQGEEMVGAYDAVFRGRTGGMPR